MTIYRDVSSLAVNANFHSCDVGIERALSVVYTGVTEVILDGRSSFCPRLEE
jgi:hypothetical protein